MSQTAAKLRCVDFFCGGGGMSQGLTDAGIEVVGALDNDPDCKATYEANHGNSKLILRDIRDMEADDLATEMAKFNQTLKQNDDNMLFVGCSPCQYWSVITGRLNSARKNKAHSSRNLLEDFTRFVQYYQPGYVLLENVRGLTRNERESGLAELKRFFDDTGYTYENSEAILEASWYGVPQTRSRYVLIASRVTENIELPVKEDNQAVVRNFIAKLPAIEAGAGPRSDDALHRSSGLHSQNIKRLELTPEGGQRSHWAEDEELMIDAYKGKSLKFFRENYGRMEWGKPAPTVTTKFHAIGCGRFGHPEQNRAISLREGALLQTFPLNYQFKTETITATARLIGNAVPPKLAEHIGKAILKAMHQ